MNQTATIDANASFDQKAPKSEFKLALVAFLYFLFVICSYYVLKPVRDALALDLGATNINILNIISMFTLILANAVYSYIVGKYKREVFIPNITRFFAFCLIIFWAIFSFVFPISKKEQTKPATTEVSITEVASQTTQLQIASETSATIQKETSTSDLKETTSNKAKDSISWAYIIALSAFYLYVNMYSLILVCMFWSFINDVFTVAQGKRLYVYIGYGGLIGGIIGSDLTTYLVKTIQLNIPTLYLIAIALLYPSIWCMKYIHNNYSDNKSVDKDLENKPEKETKKANPFDGFVIVSKNLLLILMALEVFLYTCSTTFFSQQLNTTVEKEIVVYENVSNQSQPIVNTDNNQELVIDQGATKKARTAFMSNLYGNVNKASLIAQLIVTKLVMYLPNPIYGLLLLNIIQVIGNLLLLCLSNATLAMPTAGISLGLVIISWTFILRRCLDYSTARVLRESFYIPMPKEAKYQGKGFIDTVVFRFGDGLSSILLVGGMTYFSYGHWIDYSILLTMIIQFYVIIKAAKMYTKLVNQTEANKNSIEASTAPKATEASDSNN